MAYHKATHCSDCSVDLAGLERPHYFGGRCRDCGAKARKTATSAWRNRNPEKYAAIQQRYHRENSERLSGVRKHDYLMKRLYGMSHAEYQSLLTAQGGGCAICGRKHEPTAKKMPVDHCHVTGKVRAILCTRCNTGIGMLRDDPEIAAAASEYLRFYKERP